MSHSTANKPGGGGGGGGGQEHERHPCFNICKTGNIMPDIDNPVCTQCMGAAKTAHGKAWERPVGHMVAMDIAEGVKAKARPLWEKWLHGAGNTDIHDIDFAQHMGLKSVSSAIYDKYGEGVSIKLIKRGGEICMGDFRRIYDNFDNQWSMVVGFWVGKEKGKQKCRCVYEAYLIKLTTPNVGRALFFGKDEEKVSSAKSKINKLKVVEDLRALIFKTWEFMGRVRREKIWTKDNKRGGGGGIKVLRQMGRELEDVEEKNTALELDAAMKADIAKINAWGGILAPRIKLNATNHRLQGAIPFGKFNEFKFEEVTLLSPGKYPRIFAPILYDDDTIQTDPGNKKEGCVVMGGKRKTKRRKRRRKRRKTHKKRKRKPKKKHTRRRRKRR